eukprot:m.1586591 g.1586591  ORF g.1586591 m.1586591 type:complete len:242 (+) comp25328_c1_seq7:127-852(+)
MMDRPFNRHVRIESVLVEMDSDSEDDNSNSSQSAQANGAAKFFSRNCADAVMSTPAGASDHKGDIAAQPSPAQHRNGGEDSMARTDAVETEIASATTAPTLSRPLVAKEGITVKHDVIPGVDTSQAGVPQMDESSRPERRRRRRTRTRRQTRVQVDVVAPFEVHRMLSKLKHDDDFRQGTECSGARHLEWTLKDMVCGCVAGTPQPENAGSLCMSCVVGAMCTRGAPAGSIHPYVPWTTRE